MRPVPGSSIPSVWGRCQAEGGHRAGAAAALPQAPPREAGGRMPGKQGTGHTMWWVPGVTQIGPGLRSWVGISGVPPLSCRATSVGTEEPETEKGQRTQ